MVAGVSVRARMLRRMQSKAKVQKSLKDPRGSLHYGLAQRYWPEAGGGWGSAGPQLLMSRRRPSELSWAMQSAPLCWAVALQGPRSLRLGWAVRVSYQARLWSCRPGWGASCRPLRRKHRSIGSLPKVLQVEQDAIKSMPGRGGGGGGRSRFPVTSESYT